MSRLSQRELLTEGFLDTIRKYATKPAAKLLGAAGGAALGAAKNVGKDLLYMNPNANLFTAAAAGAKKGAKTGYDVTKRATTSLLDMLKEKLKNEYYDKFDFNTIQYGPEEKNPVNKNVTKIPFTAKQTNKNIDLFYGEIVNTGAGKYNITIKNNRGTVIPSRRPSPRQGTPSPQQGTPAPAAAATSPGPAVSTKPKFVDALRDWKINNIGPSAATVGINYQQAKSFLQSLNVRDPDRVLSNAGIKDTGSRIISNRQLADIEFTLKSRNLVECTQLDTLQQLKILFLIK